MTRVRAGVKDHRSLLGKRNLPLPDRGLKDGLASYGKGMGSVAQSAQTLRGGLLAQGDWQSDGRNRIHRHRYGAVALGLAHGHAVETEGQLHPLARQRIVIGILHCQRNRYRRPGWSRPQLQANLRYRDYRVLINPETQWSAAP